MIAVAKGEYYTWQPPGMDDTLHVEVRRVAADGRWADVLVTDRTGATWTKRQPLDSIVLTPTNAAADAWFAERARMTAGRS